MYGIIMGRVYRIIKWSYLNFESLYEYFIFRDCWIGKKFVGRVIGNLIIVKDF